MEKRWIVAKGIAAFLIILLISGCAAGPRTSGQTVTRYISIWAGFEIVYMHNGLPPSHTVAAVEEGKPAFRAGLQAGDEIMFVESRNAGYLTTEQIAKRFRISNKVNLRVKREGHRDLIPLTITKDEQNSNRQQAYAITETRGGRPTPTNDNSTMETEVSGRQAAARRVRSGLLRSVQTGTPYNSANDRVTDPFDIPGTPARDTTATGINELKRVYLDPSSGRLVFVGTYNNEYATGAIDYSALLNDAMKSPAPSFSLDPTPESKRAISNFASILDQEMQRNLSSVEAGKAWLTSIFDRLVSDPTLGKDRQRFFKKGAEILKCTTEEMPQMIQVLLNRVHQNSPDFVKYTSKLYDAMDNPQFAFFMRTSEKQDVDPGPFFDAIDWLGLTPLRQDLMARIESGALTRAQGDLLLEAGLWEKNFIIMKVPEYRWKNTLENAKAHYNETALRKLVADLNAELFTERIMEPWLNGVIFSEQFLHRMFNLPQIETIPSCREGLSPDSELARTFLEADWYLKTLTGEPELAEKVPGHVTRGQFLTRRESITGQYNTNGVEGRFWLQPESAPISYDIDKGVITFKTPKISINAELLSFQGGSSSMSAMVQDGLDSYGKLITQNYEAYAKALPPLHRLREAAKVLAFANWARNHGIRLQPPEPPAAPVALPARFFRGFWCAQIVSQNDRTFIEYSAEGGVDFGQSVGSNWIQAHEDSSLGNTAIEQLAGSAALGQEAVDAALNGDLDAARTLADQSALAMTGEYDFTGNPALALIPEASPPAPVFQAELQTETIRQTKQALDTLRSGDPQQKEQATQKLQQIRSIITAPSPSSAQVHTWVKLLRNGTGVTNVAQVPQPAPEKPIATPVQGPRKDNIEEITASEKEHILGEITDLRRDLCRIQTQLRRFNATIQADQAQRGEWEKTVDDAYNRALDRAKDKLSDFSIDFPEGILQDRLDSIIDPVEREKFERALRMVQHLKEAYKVRDFSEWASNEKYSRKEIIDGIKMIATIIGVDDKIKNYLIKRWGLGRVLAYKDAAEDLITSAYDVTAEVVSWQRLSQLNRNSDAFLKAVEKLGRHQRAVMEQIHEREIRLGLKPGETKDLCP